jgi:GNAT superfamily N-acetyltransferase
MQLVAGTVRDGASLAELINITCRDKRNFTPVTEQTLQAVWSRDPAGDGAAGLFLVKGDNGTLLGAAHALYDDDAEKGYLPYLLSRPGDEDRVWPLLLSACERYLEKALRASSVTIGSPYTPLYCAREGRFQPLWGTTEIMEPETTDEKLIAFLRERGFRLRRKHLTMTKVIKGGAGSPQRHREHGEEPRETKGTVLRGNLKTGGTVLRGNLGSPLYAEQKEPSPLFSSPFVSLVLLRGAECRQNNYDWYGATAAEEFGQPNYALNVLAAREDYRVMGHIAWYAMRQCGKAAICDLEVAKQHRRQGIGAYLVQSALAHLAARGFSEVELCTTPAQSRAAYRLYLRCGFTPAATWLEMSKKLC